MAVKLPRIVHQRHIDAAAACGGRRACGASGTGCRSSLRSIHGRPAFHDLAQRLGSGGQVIFLHHGDVLRRVGRHRRQLLLDRQQAGIDITHQLVQARRHLTDRIVNLFDPAGKLASLFLQPVDAIIKCGGKPGGTACRRFPSQSRIGGRGLTAIDLTLKQIDIALQPFDPLHQRGHVTR